ncbi:MAG: TraB/GumN family protein [Burkholderiaceae bacterium]
MKKKISLIVIALLGLLTPFSYAETSLAPAAPAVTEAATAAHRGTLYRVSHKGNTSYLFGTIHVGKPAFYPLGAEVMQAFSKASKVAFEMDLENAKAIQDGMQKYGMYKTGDSLKNHLPADTLAKLKLALEKANLPMENFMQMKPWVLADVLMVFTLEQSGYDREHGIEEFLLKQAKQQKKQVIGLESADFQFSLFDGLNEQEQTQFLGEVLDEIEDGKARKETDDLAEAWSKADAKELTRLMNETLSEKTVSSEFTKRVLLDQRNPGMATRIEGLLKHDKLTFVGVGLLHLIGEKSVPALLRQRGYVVVKVY